MHFQVEIQSWHLGYGGTYYSRWFWGLNGLCLWAPPASPVTSATTSHHPPGAQTCQTMLCSFSSPRLCTLGFPSQDDLLPLPTHFLYSAHFLLVNSFFHFLPSSTRLKNNMNWHYLFKSKEVSPPPSIASTTCLGRGRRCPPLSTPKCFLGFNDNLYHIYH